MFPETAFLPLGSQQRQGAWHSPVGKMTHARQPENKEKSPTAGDFFVIG
jgi:hypothetical protein